MYQYSRLVNFPSSVKCHVSCLNFYLDTNYIILFRFNKSQILPKDVSQLPQKGI